MLEELPTQQWAVDKEGWKKMCQNCHPFLVFICNSLSSHLVLCNYVACSRAYNIAIVIASFVWSSLPVDVYIYAAKVLLSLLNNNLSLAETRWISSWGCLDFDKGWENRGGMWSLQVRWAGNFTTCMNSLSYTHGELQRYALFLLCKL